MSLETIFLYMALAAAPVGDGALKLDPVFADHMVLQQGKTIPVRGSASPGAIVSVEFNGATATARADDKGRWVVLVPAQSGGAVATLSVSSETGERLILSDVAVGEVWLCSGQSNMDLPVAQSANPERTAREAKGQPIRLLKLRRAGSASRGTSFSAEIPWSVADETNVSEFSAACWHMARSMRARGLDVPIGLIHAAWGGSTIEDWMSPDALRSAGVAEQALASLQDYAANPSLAIVRAVQQTDMWASANDSGSDPKNGWFVDKFDASDWQSIPVPGQWERSGIKGLTSYDGVMWFRHTFSLTSEQAAAGKMLSLGRIDERDRVWINGRNIGATLGTETARSYPIPSGLLRAGINTVAVRVIDEMGGGGFSSPPDALAINGVSGKLVPLAGIWRYQTGSSDEIWKVPPPFLPWSTPRGLSMAWNGMIAPFNDFPLGGIAWYQGESNTTRASSYGKLLESWRAAWRAQFGDPRLPVLIVQLPGYGPPATRPTDGGWARLREVQRRVAQADPKTGLAVTIDLGVSNDIHPAHKDVVGQRMAAEAMRVAYNVPGPVAPSPVSARRGAKGVVIQFSGASEGLTTYGARVPTSFEWCDAAKTCYFADAVVDGETVVVTAPAHAKFVRYAWQGFPPVNLYGSGGLPVVPFEMPVA